MISPFDLVSISLIRSDVEHYAYEYWSLLCLLWINVYLSHLHIFYFFNISYLPVLVLKLSCGSCYIIWILAHYADTKFADTSSHSISLPFCWLLRRPSFLHMVILEPWKRSFGLISVNLFKIPSLWFPGLSACLAAGRTQFWLLCHSYLFWIQEAWRPHCHYFLSRLFLLFEFLFSCISFRVWGFFISIVIFYFQNVMGPCQWFQDICSSLLGA